MSLETSLVAAPLALLVAGLGLQISRRRRRDRIGPGMTGDPSFVRLQRAFGNAVEHTPLVLLLLLMLELSGGSKVLVLGVGAALLVSRFAHAAGIILRPRHPLHFAGAATTYGLEVVLAILLVRAYMTAG
jgi:uncharacterized membrane protein YecN with MAPEG domain